MKKLLLSTLLCAFVFVGAFAQFNYTTNTNIGHTLKNVQTTDKDTLLVHFNTALVNSTWAKARATASLGKDSVQIRKCQTQKGMQAIVYTDGTTTANIQSGNFKNLSYTANGNPVHVYSLDSLLKIMGKSANQVAPYATINGNAADSLTAPAHCLFDVTPTNQVYGVYPGKYKHVEYGYYISLSGKTLIDDITFKMGTFNNGTTTKTAKYELTVYANTSTISSFSTIGGTSNDTYLVKRIADFYVTGSGEQTVNLSTITGKTPDFFTNKYVYIFLKTLGTSNASGTVDGLPNTSANKIPVAYDPIIYFDDFSIMYSVPVWSVPTGAIQNAYLNYNNGTVSTGSSTDYSGGTATSIYPGQANNIKFLLTDSKRASNLTITEANDGGGTNPKYYFASTGAIKAKSGALGFVTDVPYTFTPTDGTSKFLLSISAPTSGLANDTLEVTMTVANVNSGMSSSERLEINNGIRFYYSFGVKADLSTGLSQNALENLGIWASENQLFVNNAQLPVMIFSVSGQKIKVATALEASKGIKLDAGIYIVKTGSTIQKVFLK